MRSNSQLPPRHAGAALLVGAQLLLVAGGAVRLLRGDRLGARLDARPLLASPEAKHAGGLPGGGELGLGLLAPLGGAVQLPAPVAGGLGEPATKPVPLRPQLGGREPAWVQGARGVERQPLAAVPAQRPVELRERIAALDVGQVQLARRVVGLGADHGVQAGVLPGP
jgi:hypothetical protein